MTNNAEAYRHKPTGTIELDDPDHPDYVAPVEFDMSKPLQPYGLSGDDYQRIAEAIDKEILINEIQTN